MRRLFCLMAAVFCLSSISIQAQTQDPRFYSEAHVTVMNFKNQQVWDVGFGNVTGYEISKRIALETEVNFFPAKQVDKGGRKVETLFQLKAGQKFNRFGIFARVGPGFRTLSKGTMVLDPTRTGCNGFPGTSTCTNYEHTTDFASHIGAALEIYTSKRTFVRFDAGNTMIADSGSSHHNFQTSSGFGFRF